MSVEATIPAFPPVPERPQTTTNGLPLRAADRPDIAFDSAGVPISVFEARTEQFPVVAEPEVPNVLDATTSQFSPVLAPLAERAQRSPFGGHPGFESEWAGFTNSVFPSLARRARVAARYVVADAQAPEVPSLTPYEEREQARYELVNHRKIETVASDIAAKNAKLRMMLANAAMGGKAIEHRKWQPEPEQQHTVHFDWFTGE